MKSMFQSLAMGLALSAVLVASQESFANASAESAGHSITKSYRLNRKLGAQVGVGEPYPALLGLNISYNVLDYLRASIGHGEVEVTTGLSFNESGFVAETAKATTIGAGVKAFIPGLSLTPTIGLNVAHVEFQGSGELSLMGIKESGALLYSTLGVDWQSERGYQVGLGTTIPFKSGAQGSFYASAGWFSDILQ